MNITVMGAGAVGGYFGGLLAKAGNKVTFVARGPHLEAIRKYGLKVKSDRGSFTVPVAATDNPLAVGPSKLILFTVKTYDTELALASVKSMLNDDTIVLTLQNGTESYRTLVNVLGADRVLAGAAYIESRIKGPGVVQQTGSVVRIVFGQVNGERAPVSRAINKTFVEAGIDCELSSNVLGELWTKFIFIAAVAGLTSACRARLGTLLNNAEYKELLMTAMNEIEAVGLNQGVSLDADVVERTMKYVEGAVKNITASMHTDLESGRRLELEALNGAVVRMGREGRIDTPVNSLLYLMLKPHINGTVFT